MNWKAITHSVALAALLALAGCDELPTSRWSQLCANETGPRYYSRPPAGSLATLNERDAEFGLLLIRASAVDLNVLVTADHEQLYSEGLGIYRVRLTPTRSPECERQLVIHGYDPGTLEFTERQYRDNLDACYTAERIGDAMDDFAANDVAARTFTSDYIVRSVATTDRDITRIAMQIVKRETGQVIAEQISFTKGAGIDYRRCPRDRRFGAARPYPPFAVFDWPSPRPLATPP